MTNKSDLRNRLWYFEVRKIKGQNEYYVWFRVIECELYGNLGIGVESSEDACRKNINDFVEANGIDNYEVIYAE